MHTVEHSALLCVRRRRGQCCTRGRVLALALPGRSCQAVNPPPVAARQRLGTPTLLGRPATITAHHIACVLGCRRQPGVCCRCGGLVPCLPASCARCEHRPPHTTSRRVAFNALPCIAPLMSMPCGSGTHRKGVCAVLVRVQHVCVYGKCAAHRRGVGRCIPQGVRAGEGP